MEPVRAEGANLAQRGLALAFRSLCVQRMLTVKHEWQSAAGGSTCSAHRFVSQHDSHGASEPPSGSEFGRDERTEVLEIFGRVSATY